MITLQQWMETVNFRVTEGSEYLWNCYGPNAYSLDSWDGRHGGGSSFTIIFDNKTQEVYEVQAHDYDNNRAYRLINPAYSDTMYNEASYRNVNKKQAWDEVDYVDLESEEDWLEKARAIFSGEDYDTRVSIPLTLDDADLLFLMKAAHSRDLTFNEFVEEILREHLRTSV